MTEIDAHTSIDRYIEFVVDLLHGLDHEAVVRVCGHLQRARDAGATVYLAGNGGSAATAAHWVNDLGKAARSTGMRHIRAVSLADHLSWLTALGNDEGFDRVFAGQLENYVQPGDLLVVFSASGQSPNLIEAVRTAKARGAVTIALLGFDGGALKGLVDEYIWLPTPRGAYGPVEDAHMVVCHILTGCLAKGGVDRPAALLAVHASAAVRV
jgi:D-sedoheptulose 7-phosphate isomerase